MTDSREKAYEEGINKINKVFEIFKDYFTEERVDLQNVISFDTYRTKNSLTEEHFPFIIVHFPEVTIINEHDDSTLLKNLWAKVQINFEGKIVSGFSLNRSTYQYTHWVSDYMHSHISGIPKDDVSRFISPCLGSGPIRDTIASLAGHYDESLWYLFCRELDVYTRTESLTGGPYRRMVNIGNINSTSGYIYSFSNPTNYHIPWIEDKLSDFITYLINKNVLSFNYSNNTYSIAMNYYDYYITISNVFIEWYNTRFNEKIYRDSLSVLLDSDVIVPVKIINGEIRRLNNSSNHRIERLNGRKVLTFKGNDILLEIEAPLIEETDISYLLNVNLATSILRTILAIINYKYGRQTNNSFDTPEGYLV